ncbi:MAG TPA: hypothetical protein VGJ67_08220 [Actinomycetota bacterium]
MVLKATFGGHEVDLGDCAALVGLKPVPQISLKPGERLTLEAPIRNARPPAPSSTDHAVLRPMSSGSGDLLGAYTAGRPGTSTLVIEHPGPAVCTDQPADRCVVASVSVGT